MTGMELKILDWLQTIRTPIGDALMCFITSLGNVGAIWIVLAVVLIAIPKTRKSGIIVAAALIIDAALCSGILKNVFCRIRPFDVNTAVQVLITFPSGHTSASFAAATALYLAKERKLFATTLVLACLIAFSRMYLYVHYPTDIIGGILIGITSAYLAYWCQKKIPVVRRNSEKLAS